MLTIARHGHALRNTACGQLGVEGVAILQVRGLELGIEYLHQETSECKRKKAVRRSMFSGAVGAGGKERGHMRMQDPRITSRHQESWR